MLVQSENEMQHILSVYHCYSKMNHRTWNDWHDNRSMCIVFITSCITQKRYVEAAVQIMASLGQRYNSILAYNPMCHEKANSILKVRDWIEFYQDSKEALPTNASELRGKETSTYMTMESDHISLKRCHRLRIGCMMFLLRLPCFSDSQKIV